MLLGFIRFEVVVMMMMMPANLAEGSPLVVQPIGGLVVVNKVG